MLAFLLSLFLLSHAAHPILLPKDVLSAVQDEYPSETPMKPVVDDIVITIKGDKTSQEVKLNPAQEVLDLAPYVNKKEASFTLFFKPSFEVGEQTKLFFISRYQPSVEKGAHGGLGCGKALKIQKHLDKLFTTQGVKFMTKDASYLNLLGGDFLVTHLDGQTLHVVFFKIVDGRFSNRLCH